MARTIRLSVRRQDTPASSPYWEEYELPYRPRENVISVLMEIAKRPKTREGKATSPVVYDRACLEEVCGSCAMRVNGVALFNRHPTGRMLASERLEALMGEGGLDECGNAQNCVRACPKSIPLTTSIAEMFRATTAYGFKKLFGT